MVIAASAGSPAVAVAAAAAAAAVVVVAATAAQRSPDVAADPLGGCLGRRSATTMRPAAAATAANATRVTVTSSK